MVWLILCLLFGLFARRLFLQVFLCGDGDITIGMVVPNGIDNFRYHLFQFLHEVLGIVCATLYFTKFLFPTTCELGTFEQFLVDDANELNACWCGKNALALSTNISALEECLDDGGTT